jgi:WD40 repeat protein/DNA-binding SARP family transcriptional activator
VDSPLVGIGVLGPLTIDGGSAGATRPGPRDRTVLAALVVGGAEALSLDQLAEAVWGAEPPASWRKVLHGCVARLRRALGPDAIETMPAGYRLTATDTDARRFDRLVRRGREQLDLGAPDRALFLVDEALALWRGRPLVDVEGWEPGRTEAGRLTESRLDAQELRLDAALRAGRHLEILAEARARAGETPLRERRWALLALAQYRAGQQSEALASLRRVRTLLDDELGVDPGDDLVALETAILRHDPSLRAAGPPPRVAAGCPYPGLLAYDVDDADMFFGRAAETAECLRRLSVCGVLAVVGASGSGKSSLVRAGVVAGLRGSASVGRPAVVVTTPGRRPMEALPPVPAQGPAPVLVVDQCEEVFTLCRDPVEQREFLGALEAWADRAALVVVLRADRFAEASTHAGFARLVERGLYLLGPMGPADLRTAIEAPAARSGLRLEPGLVDLLVRDVEGQPGALPLLSHALRQTWRRREGATLTVGGYRDAGGIREAVANTAEELYERMPAEERPLVRDLFLRLVVPAPDGEPSRSRVARRLVATSPTHDSMIERLVAARLLTSDDGVVELAHEALARAWPRLRAWLEEDTDGQRIRHHLTSAADAWDGMGRPNSEVYRGVRLAAALEWHERSRSTLNTTEAAFLAAARSLAEAEESRAAQDARRQGRVNRRLRTLLAVAAVLLVVAGGAAVVADRQSRRADAVAASADARRIGALAGTVPQVDLALLLAAHGVRMDDTAATRANLLAALNRHPQLIGAVHSPDRARSAIGAGTDGRTLALFSGSHVGVYDTATRTATWHRVDTRDVDRRGGAAVRPDGAQIAVPYLTPAATSANQRDRKSVRLVGTGGRTDATVVPQTLSAYAFPASVGYSLDRRLLVVTYREDKSSRSINGIWDVTWPDPRHVGDITTPWQTDFARLSPDGTLLYTAHRPTNSDVAATAPNIVELFDVRGPVVVSDVAHGRPVRQFATTGLPLDLSPDGRLLATAAGPPDADRPTTGAAVTLVDAVTGQQRTRLDDGGPGDVRQARFSPDGRLVAVVTTDNTTTVWTVATGERLETLRGDATRVVDLAFSPDGATLYTANETGSTLIWDLRGDRRFAARRTVVDTTHMSAPAIAVAPDGDHAALHWSQTDGAGRASGRLSVADLRTGRVTPTVDTRHGRYHGVAWRPDGGQLATTGEDGFVRTWDPTSGRMLHERQVSDTDVPGVAYSPDGSRLIVTDGRLLQFDPDGLRPVADLINFPRQRMWRPTPARDGRTVVAVAAPSSGDPPPAAGRAIALADLREGRVRSVAVDVDAAAAALSPDGRRLAVAGRGGEVLLVDALTGDRVRPAVAGHDGGAGSIAFSADGRTLVVGGSDGRVTTWDGHTGELLGAITLASSDHVTYPAFRPDGHTVVVMTSAGTAFTWDTDPRHWTAHACTVAGRNLTRAEWSQVLGDRPYEQACRP